MKFLFIFSLCYGFCSVAFSQDSTFPNDLYAMPIANDMAGHQWSYRQGLDFDVLGFKNAKGNGVTVYLGVDAKRLQSQLTGSFVRAKRQNQEIKLYKKCESDDQCRYTTLINAGAEAGDADLWAQIWLIPESGELKYYLDWLSSLKFVAAKL